MKHLSLILISLLLAVSCVRKEKERVLVIPPEDAETDATTGPNQNKVRAEKLVNSAEELLSPIGFMLADQILDQALKNDPGNRKAQFYKLSLAPLMKMRGMFVRMAPIRDLAPKMYEDMSTTTAALGDFLRDRSGGPAFRNEADFQKLLEEIQAEQKKIGEFISRNRGFITRIVVSHVHQFEKMLRGCAVSRMSRNSYRISPCSQLQQIKLRMNRGDWEAFYQAALGARMTAAVALSYNLEGALSFASVWRQRKHVDKRDFKAKEKVELMDQHPNAGKLLAQHQLDVVRERSVDAYTGIKWLFDAQTQLCLPPSSKREEHVFRRICLNKVASVGPAFMTSASALDLFRNSISGSGGSAPTIKPFKGRISGREMDEVRMDLLAPIKYPLEDLRILAPRTFDACGNKTSFGDPTLGGVFPNANADEILIGRRHDCPQAARDPQ